MLREKRLVRGDDVLPRVDRGKNKGARGFDSAHRLDRDRDLGILHDFMPVNAERPHERDQVRTVLGVTARHILHFDPGAGSRADLLLIAVKHPADTAADGSCAGQTDFH